MRVKLINLEKRKLLDLHKYGESKVNRWRNPSQLKLGETIKKAMKYLKALGILMIIRAKFSNSHLNGDKEVIFKKRKKKLRDGVIKRRVHCNLISLVRISLGVHHPKLK